MSMSIIESQSRKRNQSVGRITFEITDLGKNNRRVEVLLEYPCAIESEVVWFEEHRAEDRSLVRAMKLLAALLSQNEPPTMEVDPT